MKCLRYWGTLSSLENRDIRHVMYGLGNQGTCTHQAWCGNSSALPRPSIDSLLSTSRIDSLVTSQLMADMPDSGHLAAERHSSRTYELRDLQDIVLGRDKLERCNPSNDCPRDDIESASRNSTPTLGNLDILPFELRTNILLDLDLQSLTQFRTINRRARFLIDNIPEYNNLVTHAPSIRRAALSIHIAPSLPCRTLYCALRSQACTTCGHSGPFIYMSLGCRVCNLCQMKQPQFWPLTPSQAKDLWGLDSRQLSLIPEIFGMPNGYSCIFNELFVQE